MSEQMKGPIIGEPMQVEEALEVISAAEYLQDMSWALRDWLDAANYLSGKGAPDLTEEGNTMPMVERFKWVVEQGLV